MTTPGYDVVVVGAGTAGAIVAAELAADPARTVLVLEAGPVPDAAAPPPRVDARVVPGADPERHAVWRHPTRLTATRDHTLLTGRGLGGSSAINGTYFVRPRPDDVRAWHAAAGELWAPGRVLRALVDLEDDLDFGATDVHGAGGPIPVQRTATDGHVARLLAGAATELGFPADPDKNAWGPEGVGPVPCSARDGGRWDAGADVLRPLRGRPNLTVAGGARVRRVLVARGRAVGVAYDHDGALARVRADRVVLCAGAIGSAQLLWASGIGPADTLRAAGVDVVADVPGVAAAFSSHPQIVVQWLPRAAVTPPADSWLAVTPPADSWLAGALHVPGLELLAAARPLHRLAVAPEPGEGAQPLALMAQVVTPRREGRMRWSPDDPDAPLRLDHGYLAAAGERRQLREAVRLCAALLRSRAWNADPIGLDRAVLADDRQLDGWVAAHLGTAVHVAGTAPFGGEDAAVDGAGRVRGVPGLTVADAAILPATPRRGPAASVALAGLLVARSETGRG